MKWSYGVTTCTARIEDPLLLRTVKSLATAGFDQPRLFIDGPCQLPAWTKSYEVTHRVPKVRTFGNWFLSAMELYIRQPSADLYGIFQDDFVTYPNLRKYLETCKRPAKGYMNLYTFPENEKNFRGWYESNQAGRGAVALVFSNEALRTLFIQSHMVNRPLDPKRGWRAVDGGIVESMRKAGWKEFVHNPSLVQHTGNRSSMGNRRHPQAATFLGEEFDALRLLAPVRQEADMQPKGKRIGLVGYNCRTGLGELNRQLATYCDIDVWLVKPHPKGLASQPPHEDVDTIVCPNGDSAKIEEFLRRVDTVVFAEDPLYSNLVDLCVQHHKRIVCIPMMEWMPPGARGWPQLVHRLICPTRHCYDQFAHVCPSVDFPWPVDTARFNYRPRETCQSFLFINGQGGWNGRKGADVVKQALRLWPDMPLFVRSQKTNDWPTGPNLKFLGETLSNADLYGEGDVLICPHSVDGLGLEPMEAMASGMPVITTNGRPWTEIPALAHIPSRTEDRKVRRPVKWHLPDPAALVDICQRALGQSIAEASQQARAWAISRSWETKAEQLNKLIRGEE